jgi:hypothetical protein
MKTASVVPPRNPGLRMMCGIRRSLPRPASVSKPRGGFNRLYDGFWGWQHTTVGASSTSTSSSQKA